MKAFLLKTLIASVAVIAPAKDVMLAVLVLIVADLVTGVLAALKRKEKITSAGLYRTMTKIMVYELSIILGFIAQKHLLMDSIPIINIIGSYVGLTELVSAYENINKISGQKLLAQILKKLRSKNDQ